MAKRFYNTQVWQNIRKIFLRSNPLCVDCKKLRRTVIATQVDHIIPIAEGGSATDPANLQGLCDTHHSQKTRRENAPKREIKTTLEFSDAVITK